MRIKFLLVCEGSSDRGLVPHLEALCVRAGADEAIGDAPDLGRLPRPPGRAVDEQVRALLKLGAEMDLLFVHRDADSDDARPVRQEILAKLAGVEGCPAHICVVPVQELEAWLLVDEQAIRTVVGNPGGREDLGLPPRRRIESTARPKERLEAALIKASGAGGARLQRVKDQRSILRGVLLQRLDINGPVNELPAWCALVEEIETAVAQLRAVSGALTPSPRPRRRRGGGRP